MLVHISIHSHISSVGLDNIFIKSFYRNTHPRLHPLGENIPTINSRGYSSFDCLTLLTDMTWMMSNEDGGGDDDDDGYDGGGKQATPDGLWKQCLRE